MHLTILDPKLELGVFSLHTEENIPSFLFLLPKVHYVRQIFERVSILIKHIVWNMYKLAELIAKQLKSEHQERFKSQFAH